jgi:hypothetical protein
MYDCHGERERLQIWLLDLKSGRERHFRRGPEGDFSIDWTEALIREIEEDLAILGR